MHIGFLGLGQMGRPMAQRLAESGHRVVAWNRTRAAGEALVEKGVRLVDDPREAVVDADAVITMLADDAAVESTWIARGLVAAMRKGAVHLNMATISVALARRLADAHQRAGSGYVAAPVFGRPMVAATGQLDLIVAGADAALAQVEPLFGVLGKQTFRVGADPGRANAVKIARNFLLATVIESLGEAFAMTERHGVARADFLAILAGTSLGSPAVKSYGKMMVDQAYANASFNMKLGLKDVELALQTAAEVRLPLPSGELIRKQFLAGIAAGQGELDWTVLAEHIGRQNETD